LHFLSKNNTLFTDVQHSFSDIRHFKFYMKQRNDVSCYAINASDEKGCKKSNLLSIILQ